ncbi:MAG: mechanosensitive ion channel protein [Nitrospirales bacterium]|nr:MAG: mechanosensitive ion channel protein [Nitrospirales bacterium]
MEDMVAQGIRLLTTYGLNVIGAILILIVGRMVASWVAKGVDRWLQKSGKVDDTLRPFFAQFARYIVLIITVLAVLSQFGIETTSLIAVLGAASLAIGLALQGTLSNVAAGVMLLIFRPFKVGDYVEAAGIAGTVKTITLFVTELATPDNVQILAPNSQVWGAVVKNYSFHDTRRVDFVLGMDYGDDIDKAIETVHSVAKADDRIFKDPAPMAVVGNLGESSVDLTIRVWCKAADYWAVKFDTTKALKQRFDAEGLSIPFPQRTIHMVKAEA